eukprot:TRINITY_DN8205_c0_g2_i4.p1 TRINITY_DN8205_c0_g2~~TRINITY_DN8205_c0_g2_i4.p1  ORF type:complete len:494 (-),score=56.14 TRINITY_DN8205_c0_g2_i4:242-1723(-)
MTAMSTGVQRTNATPPLGFSSESWTLSRASTTRNATPPLSCVTTALPPPTRVRELRTGVSPTRVLTYLSIPVPPYMTRLLQILTKFSLADPHRNFFSVVKVALAGALRIRPDPQAPKPVLTYYGGAADPSSINVSDLNDLIFNETWPVILWSAILILTLVFLIWFLENHLQKLPGGISFTSGIYFAITTFTTVGYGDLVPKTRLSKILTATFMLISLILVAVLTSSFTSISNRELLQSAVYANKHITVGVVNGSVPSITSLASYLFPTYQYFRFSDLVVSALNRQEAVSVLLDGYTTQAYSSGYVSMYDFATTSPNFESDAKYSIASQSSGTFYSGFIANLEDSTRVAFECWLSKAKTSMYEHLTKLDQDYQAFQEERYRSSSSTLGSEYDSAVTSYLKQNLKWLVATCAGLIFVFVLGGQTALWISGKPLPVDDERNASIAGSSDFDAAFGSLSLSARALEEPLLQGCSNRRRTGSVMLEDVERRSSEPLHE